MTDDIIPYDERCDFCRRRKATKLCDYPVGVQASPHMIAKYGKVITCDRLICDECATNLGYEMDFCPTCMEKVRKLTKGTSDKVNS